MDPSLYGMASGTGQCFPVTLPPGEQHQLTVFWYPAEESYLTSPHPAVMSLQQKVRAFLLCLFGGFKCWGMINLVQFWAPFTTNTGGKGLSVWNQPFAVGQSLCDDVCKYRQDSILSILDESHTHTVQLAFSNGRPYLQNGIPSSWAFPLFERSSTGISVGVLEFVSSTDCSELFQYCSVSQLYEQFCLPQNGHFFYESGGHITADFYNPNLENMAANEDQQVVQYEEEYHTTNPANMVESEILNVCSYRVMPQHHDLNMIDNNLPITWGTEVEQQFSGLGNLVEPAHFDQLTFGDQQGNMADANDDLNFDESVQQGLEVARGDNSAPSTSRVVGRKGTLTEARTQKCLGKRHVDITNGFRASTLKSVRNGLEHVINEEWFSCNNQKRSRNGPIMVVKAKYDGVLVRLDIDSNKIEFKSLFDMLKERFLPLKEFNLSFVIEYEDADIDLAPIMISDTKDLKACLNIFKASNCKTMELLVRV